MDVVVGGPLFILDTIHSLGIPWFATLPLSALLVRGVFVYTTSTLPSRRIADIRSQIMPVFNASEIASNRNNATELASNRNARADHPMLRYYRHVNRLNAFIRHFTGAGTWWRTAINLGTVIAFAEAIRLKCGARDGLLRMVLNPLGGAGTKSDEITADKQPEAVPTSPAEALADRLEEAWSTELQRRNADGSPIDLSTLQLPSDVHSTNTPDVASVYFDPSLQAEGLPWCTDLTLCDATMILPVAMASVFAFSVILRPRFEYHRYGGVVRDPSMKLKMNQLPTRAWIETRARRQTKPSFLDTLTVVQKLGLCASLVLVIAVDRLPAALLLYLITSMATGWLQGRWLDFRRPLARPIRATNFRLLRTEFWRYWK